MIKISSRKRNKKSKKFRKSRKTRKIKRGRKTKRNKKSRNIRKIISKKNNKSGGVLSVSSHSYRGISTNDEDFLYIVAGISEVKTKEGNNELTENDMSSKDFFIDCRSKSLYGDIVIKKAKENIRKFFELNEGYFKEEGPLKIENNIVFLSGHDKNGNENEEFGIPKYLENDIVKEKKIRLIIDKSTIKFFYHLIIPNKEKNLFEIVSKFILDKNNETNEINKSIKKYIPYELILNITTSLAIMNKYKNIKEIYSAMFSSSEDLEYDFVKLLETLSQYDLVENKKIINSNEISKNFFQLQNSFNIIKIIVNLFTILNFSNYNFEINNEKFPLKKDENRFKHFYLNVARKS